MPKYKMVMVRFNMDKDEALLYNSLNKNNKAGHIKSILKSVFDSSIEYSSRAYIEEIINNILSSREYILDNNDNSNININKNIDKNNMLKSISSIIKGG